MSGSKYIRNQLQNAVEKTKLTVEKEPSKGMYGQGQVEPTPSFKRASCEVIYAGQNNSAIVLGRDRSASLGGGGGGEGGTQCSMIDLVTGYASAYKNDKGQYGPPDADVFVDPNFFSDGARIYITQRGDIDKYFGLAQGSERFNRRGNSNSEKRSAIGIKADHVRIVGRRHIKFITGRAVAEGFGPTGERLSTGGVNEAGPGGIDFIVGNYSDAEALSIKAKMAAGTPMEDLFMEDYIDKLQPIPKGDNLVKCLNDIVSQINSLRAATAQNAIATQAAAFVAGLPTPVAAPMSVKVMWSSVQKMIEAVNGIYNDVGISANYLEKQSPLYINSKFVRTT
tara:strand:- start:2314 stop:3327 length:1014 start_codon:yes stop_codon:yes gene_type:complete